MAELENIVRGGHKYFQGGMVVRRLSIISSKQVVKCSIPFVSNFFPIFKGGISPLPLSPM